MTVAALLALYGAFTGTAALGISLANYRRDRARARIIIEWDRPNGGLMTANGSTCIKVSVFNDGRRPLFVRGGLVVFEGQTLLIENLEATTLVEGGPPATGVVQMTPDIELFLATQWWRADAWVFGVSPRLYRSRPPRLAPKCATVARPSRAARWAYYLPREFKVMRGRFKRLLAG